jgi:hypothetical protein
MLPGIGGKDGAVELEDVDERSSAAQTRGQDISGARGQRKPDASAAQWAPAQYFRQPLRAGVVGYEVSGHRRLPQHAGGPLTDCADRAA